MKSISSIVLLVAATLVISCKKDPGPGGDTTIAALVKHHDRAIPGATVYVKYGAKEFPGDSPSNYDASEVADVEGHTHFEDLKRGDYFFYAVGYDSSLTKTVKGGVHYEITKKDAGDHVDLNVQVVE
jgi:hypothetical protein